MRSGVGHFMVTLDFLASPVMARDLKLGFFFSIVSRLGYTKYDTVILAIFTLKPSGDDEKQLTSPDLEHQGLRHIGSRSTHSPIRNVRDCDTRNLTTTQCQMSGCCVLMRLEPWVSFYLTYFFFCLLKYYLELCVREHW
jgi:hypothetical protein